MDLFDLQASARFGKTITPPVGYQAGWARIADLDETLFLCTAVWSSDDYVQHWRDAAKSLSDGADFAVFCVDLNLNNVSIFAGFRIADDCISFEQWILPRSAVVVDDISITLVEAVARSSDYETSFWQVSINAIRAYAET